MAQYLASLRKLAEKCDFNNFLDQALRDKLVCGYGTKTSRENCYLRLILLSNGRLKLLKKWKLLITNPVNYRHLMYYRIFIWLVHLSIPVFSVTTLTTHQTNVVSYHIPAISVVSWAM